jgi:DNA repair protein RadD
MLLSLRAYQQEAVDSIWHYFQTKFGNPCIAMPTGTGKSLVIAGFLESIYRQYPAQKVLVLTHVKELVDQNCKKLLAVWPNAPAGIYSAGLRRKDVHHRIIFAGIASVAKKAEQFGCVHLVIIDEAHLVSPNEETMYRKFLNDLKVANPYLKVIGLTATPWRLGQGKITDDGIFTDICFDITSVGAFNRLIQEGYLAPLIPRKTELLLDISGVHKLGGEFKENELQFAVDKDAITYAALTESMVLGADRNHWLIFASGIDHANNISAMLNTLGIDCCAVHSKMPGKQRDQNILDFLSGKVRAIVSNGVLTTGFDFPAIDLIIMLRPTASTVLWVQMLGRGTRPFEGKNNCLVLDFAGNTARLGPINDPVIPRKKGEKVGEAPIRICEVCNMYNHASARFCGGHPFPSPEGCGNPFTFTTKLKKVASTHELIKSDLPIVEEFFVDSVTYAVHNKIGKPPSLRVSYYCNLRKFVEFIHFELPGWGERKAREWWMARVQFTDWTDPETGITKRINATDTAPATTAQALEFAANLLKVPTRIRVHTNKPYPEILAVSFNPDKMGAF